MGLTLDFTVMIIFVTFCLVLFSAVPSLGGAPGGGDQSIESFKEGLDFCLKNMVGAYIAYYGEVAGDELVWEMFFYENSKGAAEPMNDIKDIYPLLGNINPYCVLRVYSYMHGLYSSG